VYGRSRFQDPDFIVAGKRKVKTEVLFHGFLAARPEVL
jgi:hypothetical protein